MIKQKTSPVGEVFFSDQGYEPVPVLFCQDFKQIEGSAEDQGIADSAKLSFRKQAAAMNAEHRA